MSWINTPGFPIEGEDFRLKEKVLKVSNEILGSQIFHFGHRAGCLTPRPPQRHDYTDGTTKIVLTRIVNTGGISITGKYGERRIIHLPRCLGNAIQWAIFNEQCSMYSYSEWRFIRFRCNQRDRFTMPQSEAQGSRGSNYSIFTLLLCESVRYRSPWIVLPTEEHQTFSQRIFRDTRALYSISGF